MIQVDPKLIKVGSFIKRNNRFVASVNLEGHVCEVHVPNSGRMKELLLPDVKVGLIAKPGEHRKTKFQLTWVQHDNGWVNLDSSMPNKLLMQGIKDGAINEFKQYQIIRQEVQIGNSRLDILLEHNLTKSPLYLETKSVTLVVDGVAMFPDAPTVRGSKHLEELVALAVKGIDTAVVFIIQRRDAKIFKPNAETDPAFASNLLKALKAGVTILAYNCKVQLGQVEINEIIPIEI